ncbi:MAG: collagen-like protein [Snowella sp.]|nr:collagen-like protein [Snowella sp.]
MRRFGQLSFLLCLLALPQGLQAAPKPVTPNCDWIVQGANRRPFGTTGEMGKTGEPGQNGVDADNVTIFADGSPVTLNLAGKNGESGQAGGNAISPNCSNQPNVAENLVAPDGSNGGNGGNGGDGGNGGSISIYATNAAFLRNILVNAAGGKGGQGGQGGLASEGCNCSKSYWTVESCSGDRGSSDFRCTTKEFRCSNGRNGINGTPGLSGRDGQPGRLTLLNLNKPLEPDRPSASVTMGTLKDQGVILSRNRWETRRGAQQLLAPGSVIEDEYQFLTERLERGYLLVWNAPQSFSNFANRNLTLSLDDQQEIQATLPPDLWIEATTQKRNNVTEFLVYNAIWASDATRLGNATLLGNGQALRLTFVDQANQSNLIATKFQIKYNITRSDPRFRPVSDYSTKYSGEVPDDLVTLKGDRFTINLGKLPIPEEYLKPGLGVEVEVVANRSFSNYSTSQKFYVRDLISRTTR